MKSSFPFLTAVLKGSYVRLLLPTSVAGSPATLPRGIGGRSPSSDFLGQWYHCPCWPRPTQRTISTINNQTKERKNMHNSKIKTNHLKNQTLQSLSFGITLLTLLLVNTSCSSTQHRRSRVRDVLVGQSDLLSKLEQERRAPALLRKVRRDETLWQAEVHLREAIQALKESSQAIKSALSESHKEEGKNAHHYRNWNSRERSDGCDERGKSPHAEF